MNDISIEDNLYYGPSELASNGQLVARVVRLARELGREAASLAETRCILGLYACTAITTVAAQAVQK
jgi:3-keto-5-aminohexanoate cleavage enzyme